MKRLVILLSHSLIISCTSASQKRIYPINITTDFETAADHIENLMKAHDFYDKFSGISSRMVVSTR